MDLVSNTLMEWKFDKRFEKPRYACSMFSIRA